MKLQSVAKQLSALDLTVDGCVEGSEQERTPHYYYYRCSEFADRHILPTVQKRCLSMPTGMARSDRELIDQEQEDYRIPNDRDRHSSYAAQNS